MEPPWSKNKCVPIVDHGQMYDWRRLVRKIQSSIHQHYWYCGMITLFSIITFVHLYSDQQWNSKSRSHFIDFNPVSMFSNENVQPNITDQYLIDTEACRLKDWPMLEDDVLPLYENMTDKYFECDQIPVIRVKRVNLTWVQVELPVKQNISETTWLCYAREVLREPKSDSYDYGSYFGPIGLLTNFANNLTDVDVNDKGVQFWNSVEIMCNKSEPEKDKFTHVIPLVQYYHSKVNITKPKINVMLLGIDSISRMNFIRHFVRTNKIVDQHGFIPLYGYHKVGENTFPNIFQMLTGHKLSSYDQEFLKKSFRFDGVPLIIKEFAKRGYVTTFLEDMPPYGIFTYGRKGFRKQPTHYYLRPTNKVIWPELYYSYSCYKDAIENEVYYDYLLDLFQSFKVHDNQAHFTFSQLSTLTHNYFNHAGYSDKIFSKFLERLFQRKYNENTLILLYSDHGLRFGKVVETRSGIYEQRLPYFYIYIPDSMKIGSMDAKQLREMVKANQHKLTSHFDSHATLKHLLLGTPPTDEPFGLSLFTHIPDNRTCQQAGISLHYCMCSTLVPTPIDANISAITQMLVNITNQQLEPVQDKCEQMTLNKIQRAFILDNGNKQSSPRYLIHWKMDPSDGVFESMVKIQYENNTLGITVLGEIARLDRYGHQSKCVEGEPSVERFCYCKDLKSS